MKNCWSYSSAEQYTWNSEALGPHIAFFLSTYVTDIHEPKILKESMGRTQGKWIKEKGEKILKTGKCDVWFPHGKTNKVIKASPEIQSKQ